MLSRTALSLVLAGAALVAACAPRAEGGASTADAVPAERALWQEPSLFERVAVIGASASAGFGLEVRLGGVVEAALGDRAVEVLDAGDSFFFTSPASRGQAAVDKALAFEPTLVLARDFPVWFAYGDRPDGQRAASLERGLAQLDRLKCPMIVGGIPDMADAVGIMLTREQVPSEEAQLELDAKVRAWAEERDTVAFFDLRRGHAQTVDGEATALGVPWPPDDEDALQGDELHPTDAGLVGLLLNALDQAGLAGAVQGDAAAVLERLR